QRKHNMKMELCRGCTLPLLLSSIVKVKLLVLPNILPGQQRSTCLMGFRLILRFNLIPKFKRLFIGMLVLITSSRIFLILIKGEKGEYRFVTRKCESITPFLFLHG